MKKYITAVISIAIIACMNTGCHEDKNNTSPITTMQTTQFDGVQGNCSNGGVKIEVLVDGTVDDAQTQYLCNGDNGVNGQNGIDGSNGQDGKDGRDGRDGQVGKDGRDGQNGQDGQDGNNALVVTSDEVGDNCALGGMRIDVGLDENNNSTNA
ncbi:MAG: collagen-like protein [Proteobacteria bacterium]|nr:collagen-like protein [Pseudomonadota bacterium]